VTTSNTGNTPIKRIRYSWVAVLPTASVMYQPSWRLPSILAMPGKQIYSGWDDVNVQPGKYTRGSIHSEWTPTKADLGGKALVHCCIALSAESNEDSTSSLFNWDAAGAFDGCKPSHIWRNIDIESGLAGASFQFITGGYNESRLEVQVEMIPSAIVDQQTIEAIKGAYPKIKAVDYISPESISVSLDDKHALKDARSYVTKVSGKATTNHKLDILFPPDAPLGSVAVVNVGQMSEDEAFESRLRLVAVKLGTL
jgi:hypothetical protein